MALAASHHRLMPLSSCSSRDGSIALGFQFLRSHASRSLLVATPRSINSANVLGASSMTSNDAVIRMMVLIDQDSDRDATILQLSFGDHLWAVLDTMKALKGVGLDVTEGSLMTDLTVIQIKFHVILLGRKVEDADMSEKIQLIVIKNILQYHPESGEKLAMGEFFGVKPPEKKLDVDVVTQVLLEDDGPKTRGRKVEDLGMLGKIQLTVTNNLVQYHPFDVDVTTQVLFRDDGPQRSTLCIETTDQPGLLLENLENIKIINDINNDVNSDTEGLATKDKFHRSYKGAKVSRSLSQAITTTCWPLVLLLALLLAFPACSAGYDTNSEGTCNFGMTTLAALSCKQRDGLLKWPSVSCCRALLCSIDDLPRNGEKGLCCLCRFARDVLSQDSLDLAAVYGLCHGKDSSVVAKWSSTFSDCNRVCSKDYSDAAHVTRNVEEVLLVIAAASLSVLLICCLYRWWMRRAEVQGGSLPMGRLLVQRLSSQGDAQINRRRSAGQLKERRQSTGRRASRGSSND